MQIRYTCKGMGLNCPFVINGETVEEVSLKALEHVREQHADDFNLVQSPAQMKEMQKALARSTRVVPG